MGSLVVIIVHVERPFFLAYTESSTNRAEINSNGDNGDVERGKGDDEDDDTKFDWGIYKALGCVPRRGWLWDIPPD